MSRPLSWSIAVAAYLIRGGRFVEEGRVMFSMTFWLLSVLVPLQILLGDLHGLNTLAYQPAKSRSNRIPLGNSKSRSTRTFRYSRMRPMERTATRSKSQSLEALSWRTILSAVIKGLKDLADPGSPSGRDLVLSPSASWSGILSAHHAWTCSDELVVRFTAGAFRHFLVFSEHCMHCSVRFCRRGGRVDHRRRSVASLWTVYRFSAPRISDFAIADGRGRPNFPRWIYRWCISSCFLRGFLIMGRLVRRGPIEAALTIAQLKAVDLSSDPPADRSREARAMNSIVLDTVPIWTLLSRCWRIFIHFVDGFDLGVGMLFGLAPDTPSRNLVMNSIAPIWDGNETWLVLGGLALLAAFPLAFAIIIPAVYFPISDHASALYLAALASNSLS